MTTTFYAEIFSRRHKLTQLTISSISALMKLHDFFSLQFISELGTRYISVKTTKKNYDKNLEKVGGYNYAVTEVLISHCHMLYLPYKQILIKKPIMVYFKYYHNINHITVHLHTREGEVGESLGITIMIGMVLKVNLFK